MFMQHTDGRSTVVPMYKEIDKILLKRILKEAEVGEDKFMKNL